MPDEPGPPTEIVLRPIGWVRNGVATPRPDGWESVESEVSLLPDFSQGLRGLEGFSHVIVIFWMHLVPEELRVVRESRPGNRPSAPLVGTFATREQLRPNPIGFAVVPVLGVSGTGFRVRGLDAVDGTPVLDLKPFLPPYDVPAGGRMPDWVWG